MRAILFAEDTKPKIAEYDAIPQERVRALDIYLRHHEDWYLISGYVGPRGTYETWAILPAYVLEMNFEYDAEKIKTDWTNLVRKERP